MNKISISLFFLFTILGYYGQEKLTNKKGSEYEFEVVKELEANPCLLYTSPSPRD